MNFMSQRFGKHCPIFMKMEQTERSETLAQNSDAGELPRRKHTILHYCYFLVVVWELSVY